MTPTRFLLVLVVIVFAVCYHRITSPVEGPEVRDAPVAAGPSDSELIGNAEYAVQQQLRDPESAKFRSAYVHSVADGRRVVCGEVNLKNGFGGYAGFQRFVSTGRAAFVESQMEAKSFATVWKNLCVGSASWRPAYP